tara:strand:+ start:7996 stop:8244 length:249 start_codon:yes stop_codon:yes gene_type:complete
MYIMHFYACPLCWQCGKHEGKLTVVKSQDFSCGCKKTIFNKDKKCKKENYKCKEVMQCVLCEEQFKISEEFLKQQKMKIKDG